MTKEEIQFLIENENDWIAIKRFDYSLKKLLKRYPDGAPDRVIAQALYMTEEEVVELAKEIIERLKEKMGV